MLSSSLLFAAGLPVWIVPLWKVGLGAVAALALLTAIYAGLSAALPKLAAITLTTAKEGFAQPLFYVLLVFGIAALLTFPYIPYNTLGEDIKMLKSSGLTLVMILSIMLALWTASVSVAEEIEGRTAITVLSKPIRRWEFIVGKFLGILGPVAILFISLGTIFLATVSYKLVFDSHESSAPMPTPDECWREVRHVAPGLLLYFFETIVLTSISVAVSTRLPMFANLVICSSIYVLGHLMPLLVQSAVGEFQVVVFVSYLISTVLPVLEYFDIDAAVMRGSGAEIPYSYLAWVGVYTALFSTAAILVAMLMFDDRDLA